MESFVEEKYKNSDMHRSVELGEKALGYIKYNQTSATPDGYELWFNFASGMKPELNERIKTLLSDNPRITQEQLDDIYAQYFLGGEVDQRMEEISNQVSVELNDIIDMVGNSLANTESYSESLEVFTSELADIKDEGSLRMMISSMAAATFEMAKNSKELETNLARSKDQIDQLNNSIETIRAETMTDALTGIANRKKFDSTMDRETENTRTSGENLCLLLCDIDFFKKFNDTHGHQTGDQVLRLVAGILNSNVKGRDLAARYGGEEFAVILPNTSLIDASIVADQIRRAVAMKELVKKSTGEKLGRITLSIGVATLHDDDTIETIIDRADKCLYAAKDAGRNNVQTEINGQPPVIKENEQAIESESHNAA
ncbi:MAG: GGDEF domain-containing protein [Rhodomicrobium sp.]|nr:MAG: GGDEF domain-containing protein [Rhodomicrobium sp.]